MEHTLDFLLLGPLEVRDGGRPLHLGGMRQRSVLAILLLHAGEVVPADTLIEELWRDDPPADAASALQQHVSRLRRLLDPHVVVETGYGKVRAFHETFSREIPTAILCEEPAAVEDAVRRLLATRSGGG